jgi:hypothetical protein
VVSGDGDHRYSKPRASANHADPRARPRGVWPIPTVTIERDTARVAP